MRLKGKAEMNSKAKGLWTVLGVLVVLALLALPKLGSLSGSTGSTGGAAGGSRDQGMTVNMEVIRAE